MNASYDVKFWDIRRYSTTRGPSYTVRWTVGKREKSKSFKTKALAENLLSDLRQAAKRGEAFDVETGLPVSMLAAAKTGPSFLAFAQSYMETRWVHLSALSREAIAYAMLSIIPALTKDVPRRPAIEDLRAVLRTYALLPEKRRPTLSDEERATLKWIEEASLPLADLAEAAVIRTALDAIALTFKGTPAAATTVRRKRAILHHVLEAAVEGQHLSSNPLHGIKWKRPRSSDAVDPCVVVNPTQARALLDTVRTLGRTRGARMYAMFACMYYAALRSEEVAALRSANCELPDEGWGMLTLEKARPQTSRRWSDTGEQHEDRALKHRANRETRPVPIPPVLVAILREHIKQFGVTDDGRLFRSRTGASYTSSAISQTWQEARRAALTPAQYVSRLAARPYDLRHAAVSLWLNAGVPAPEVANRAGHSVDVLLKVYAKCIDGQRAQANGQIDRVLGE
ncbi:tyrosine-type recombinase/integrase [Herbidospora sp. NEAU-GS84]|uniref:Tyrosine-type recombinase/integrase n=1 Tax=Herbidospora solisilvae TaxID=2696284 RepID=A0A7C9N1F0_9ACTN|nr:tyrosine-type recombinase/integrase [Herbidospora solisilvae]NAS26591.1 tyrosine-type recombinase/integrase [Herbidospora solisilvae]